MIKTFKLFESAAPLRDVIRQYSIIINNVDDAVETTNILLSCGFQTYSRTEDQVKKSYYRSGYKFYEPYGDYQFSMAGGTKYDKITLEQLRNLIGDKKFKKIERPDIDPYGEEDWGLTQNESVHSELDPYGEEDWEYDDKESSEREERVREREAREAREREREEGERNYIYAILNSSDDFNQENLTRRTTKKSQHGFGKERNINIFNKFIVKYEDEFKDEFTYDYNGITIVAVKYWGKALQDKYSVLIGSHIAFFYNDVYEDQRFKRSVYDFFKARY